VQSLGTPSVPFPHLLDEPISSEEQEGEEF